MLTVATHLLYWTCPPCFSSASRSWCRSWMPGNQRGAEEATGNTNQRLLLSFRSARLVRLLSFDKSYMEGGHKEGQSQEVQVGIHKDPFDLIGILFREACDTQTDMMSGWNATVCVCLKVQHTKLLQRVNSLLHVDPESQLSQRNRVVADDQRDLCGSAVDLLHTHTQLLH